jgi:catechol-2,3-dioxygenase
MHIDESKIIAAVPIVALALMTDGLTHFYNRRLIFHLEKDLDTMKDLNKYLVAHLIKHNVPLDDFDDIVFKSFEERIKE